MTEIASYLVFTLWLCFNRFISAMQGLHNLRVFRLTGCHGDGLSLEAGLFRLNTNLEELVLRCPGLTSLPPRLRCIHTDLTSTYYNPMEWKLYS